MYGHKWFLRLGELSDASLFALMHDANELRDCKFSMHQGTDHKGQAQTNVRVDDIVATYDGLPTDEIVEWALNSNRFVNGSLILYDSGDAPLKKLFFQDAACVGLRVNFSGTGKNSSVMTQVRISPRILDVDGMSIDQKWANVAATAAMAPYSNGADMVGKALQLAQPHGIITLKLELEGKEYEVTEFEIYFYQSLDFRGEPQSEVRGGAMKFTIPSMPDEVLTKWMMKDSILKNGAFVFSRPNQSSPLKIEFEEAYCVNMETTTSNGNGLSTSFIISPNKLNLGDRRCHNRFIL